MRYHITAEELLIDPTANVRWPLQAHNELAGLIGALSSHGAKDKNAPPPLIVSASASASWEWETENINAYTEEGEAESFETRKELFLSDSSRSRIASKFKSLKSVCSFLGVPADLRLANPDGSFEFVQIRPRPQPPSAGVSLGLLWSREDDQPRATLEEMLRLAQNANSIEEVRQTLQDALDEERSAISVEEAMPAFEALWPGDSFARTAKLCSVLFRRYWSDADAQDPATLEPLLHGHNAQGLSPLAFILTAREPGWSLTPAVNAANALVKTTRGDTQMIILEAIAQGLMSRDAKELSYDSEPFFTALIERFEREEPIDFHGLINAIEAPLKPPGGPLWPPEDHAKLEALMLKAQTLPASQARKMSQTQPPIRSVIRV